ncbi:hypothetical protein C4K04_4709 [Pseudomonas chlororaphis]|uniref:Uncharacterized protein n=1 Tax=Pseudomonas chlororaphis TaxID=587753 RepID=A0A3G7TT95_9PSED|nr:hypothetical protein C4K04_3381 [Pseudomonas chlororaphis]AZE50364.1 hypothetical protein C4K04_4709 [Pseudomonas chlororaphis]
MSIAGEKAFTLNRSVPGVRRVLLATKLPRAIISSVPKYDK